MLAIASSTAWGVDRQIGVDASLKVGYSQLTGGAPSPWGVAQSVAVGFWQRSSGAQGRRIDQHWHGGVSAAREATEAHPLGDAAIQSARQPVLGRRAGRVRGVWLSRQRKERPGGCDRGNALAQLTANCTDNPAFTQLIDVTNLVRQLSVPSGLRFVGFNVRKGTTARAELLRVHPAKLTIVVADQDVAVAPGPVVHRRYGPPARRRHPVRRSM